MRRAAANCRALQGFLDDEASAQRRGWFFVERMRGLHDLALAILVGGTLIWAIGRWSTRAISTGDVVVISTMTFRILHGSRDLAMALIDTSQQFSYLRETLDIIGVPQTLSDAEHAARLRVGEGRVELSHVTFGYDPSPSGAARPVARHPGGAEGRHRRPFGRGQIVAAPAHPALP